MTKNPDSDAGLPEVVTGSSILEKYATVPAEQRSWVAVVSRPLLILVKKVLEYITLKNTIPQLAELQDQNSPRLWTVLSLVLGPAALLIGTSYFSTDDISYNRFTHLNYFKLNGEPATLITYALDLPIAIILMVFSGIFWIACVKYIAIFEREIIGKPIQVMSIATGLIWILQGIAIWQIFIGGSFWTYTAAAVVFLFAVALSGHISLHVSDEARKLQAQLPLDQIYRRFRLGYIIKCRVTQQVQQGWASLNLLICSALAALAFLRPTTLELYTSAIGFSKTSPAIIGVTLTVSYVIIFLPLAFLLTGALRSFSAEGNRRHFHAVHIINSEYSMKTQSSDGPRVEAVLGRQKVYTIEDDPTVQVEPVASIKSASELVFGIASSARLTSSLSFGTIIWLVGSSSGVALQVILVLMISFLWNDLVDFLSGRDRIGHPERPLPRGTIRPFHSILTIGLLALSFVALGFTTPSGFGIPAVTILIVGFVYSAFLKVHFPVTAVIIWCGALAVAISSSASYGLFGLLAVWVGALGREIVLDYRDMDSDHAFSGRKNIAMRLGRHIWTSTAAMIILAATLLSVEIGELSVLSWTMPGLLLVLVSFLLERQHGKVVAVWFFAAASVLMWPVAIIYA